MKIQIGLKFKAIDGPSKGKVFTVVNSDSKSVTYRSETTGVTYNAERKHFEKYLERVNKYWHETNKEYKQKRNNLKGT